MTTALRIRGSSCCANAIELSDMNADEMSLATSSLRPDLLLYQFSHENKGTYYPNTPRDLQRVFSSTILLRKSILKKETGVFSINIFLKCFDDCFTPVKSMLEQFPLSRFAALSTSVSFVSVNI